MWILKMRAPFPKHFSVFEILHFKMRKWMEDELTSPENIPPHRTAPPSPWNQNILTSSKNPKFQILIQIVHDDCPNYPFPQNRTFIYFKSSFSYIRMDNFIMLLLAHIEWLILPSSNLGQKDKKRLNYPGFIFIKSEISRTSLPSCMKPRRLFLKFKWSFIVR